MSGDEKCWQHGNFWYDRGPLEHGIQRPDGEWWYEGDRVSMVFVGETYTGTIVYDHTDWRVEFDNDWSIPFYYRDDMLTRIGNIHEGTEHAKQ